MSVINTQPLAGASGSQATGYNLTKSLRFRSSASAYLSRTPASAGNRRTFTWSGWVKLGLIDANYHSFFANGTAVDSMVFWNDNTLALTNFNGTSYLVRTTQVFRDPSAWYHLVIAFDTTQATASNRIKIYVNGVQVTSFVASTYPSQNYDTGYNTTTAQYIAYNEYNRFDGYMAEVNFIDGQQLTPSSFGENNADTGVWQPKRYTGTYGTNGFYLPFTDVATTSGSNAGLGKDFSGNGNYWTTNNISVTSGATYDSMTDVPTLTDASTANYAVLNPLRPNGSASLVNGNLGVTPSGTYCNGLSTIQLDSGSYYAECTVTTAQAMGWGIWLNSASTTANVGTTPTGFYGIYSGGATLMINGTTPYTNAGASPSNGDIVQVAWSNGKVWFGKNNTWYDSSFGTTGNPSAGTNATVSSLSNDAFSIAFCGANASPVLAANFGQRPFTYTPPTGYVALNTYNLPDSTIVAGNTVMDVTTWTGDGATTRAITNSGSFKPDAVWIKERDVAIANTLYNSIVGGGINKNLYTDSTIGEADGNTDSTYGYLSSFNSNGFSVERGSSGTISYTNENAAPYVAWQWQAGQGTTSSNTDGSITSTVSVNASAGFSIITATAPSSGNFTFGHGLGVKPAFLITKIRSPSGYNWHCWHQSLSSNTNSVIILNSTAAENTTYNMWGASGANSTTIGATVGTSFDVSSPFVCYAWSEIAGFSKFGSYTGNGSTDGVFNYLGFKPKWLMIKRTDSATAANWTIIDTSRDTYNVTNKRVFANSSSAEDTGIPNYADILSNGFKLRDSNVSVNASGSTYIYAAFAENPFKNSLAR